MFSSNEPPVGLSSRFIFGVISLKLAREYQKHTTKMLSFFKFSAEYTLEGLEPLIVDPIPGLLQLITRGSFYLCRDEVLTKFHPPLDPYWPAD